MEKATEAKTYLMVLNGEIINRVLWDGDTETWQPPEGMKMVAHDTPEAAKLEVVTAERQVALG